MVALGETAAGARELLTSIAKCASTDHELVVVVPTGATDQLVELAGELADRVVECDHGLGTATLWNRGAAEARGRWVAFCCAEEVTPGFDEALVEAARTHPSAALVIASRDLEQADPVLLAPFAEVPHGSVFLMPRDDALALGPWDEGFLDSGGLALDLCFTVWVNDRDVVVLDHGVAAVASPSGLQRRFSDKWRGGVEPPRLDECPPDRFQRNRATAASVTTWIDRDASARDEETRLMRRQLRAMGAVNRQLQALTAQPSNKLERTARGVVGPTGSRLAGLLSPSTVRRLWKLLNMLPDPLEMRIRGLARRIGVTRGTL